MEQIKFHKYQDVAHKFEDEETQGLLDGKLVMQPKLDGTNLQIFNHNGEMIITSRTEIETATTQFTGAYETVRNNENIARLLKDYPNYKIVGEWLKRHKISYAEDAYDQFYAFDIILLDTEFDNGIRDYVDWEVAYPLLQSYNIKAVPYRIITKDQLQLGTSILFNMEESRYLLTEEAIGGEGIVIKNYNYKNRFRRQIWCKIINRDSYKHKMPKIRSPKVDESLETDYLLENLTPHLLDKAYHKINDISPFTKKDIGKYMVEILTDFQDLPDNLNQKVVQSLISKQATCYLKLNHAEIFNANDHD